MRGQKMTKNSKKKLQADKKGPDSGTVNATEIAQFDRLGQQWWDENGPMRPLHRLNPVRMTYLRDHICSHFDRQPAAKALQGLKIADIGCGGGLVTEPLCRLGAQVTGIDAGAENIRIAQAHAQAQGLDIDYRADSVERIAAQGEKFDVVTALEIIEHVDDVPLFIRSCCEIVAPNGLLVFSTLNRTAKSYALGIVAAEYLLRWVPRGTHDWKKFLRPSEISRQLQDNHFKVTDVTGLVYRPLSRDFALSNSNLDVNYFLTAERA